MWRRTGGLIAGVLAVSACGGGDTEPNDTSVVSLTHTPRRGLLMQDVALAATLCTS
jgi:hypothetical protein